MTCELPRASIERMRPRRLFRSPTIAPMYSSGVTTSTSMTGSRTPRPAPPPRPLPRPPRPEPPRPAPPAGLLDPQGRGDLERHLRGVHLVVGAVGEPHADVDHRVAGQHAHVHRLAHALLDRGAVLPWNGAADDLVLEREALARLRGLGLEVDVPALPTAAGLADIAALRLGQLADRLPGGDPGRSPARPPP